MVNQETGQGRRIRLYVAWRPLALLFTGLMVLGYFCAAAALALWLDRRPHNQVTFADLALPWRWSDIQEIRGTGFAQHGMAELAAGNTARAIFTLGRALSLQPDNLGARLALARFYAEARYYDGVRRTLPPQFEFGFARGAAELLFEQARQADDHTLILETSRELRARVEPGSEDDQWLVEQQAEALMGREAFDAAADLLMELDSPSSTSRGRTVQALVAAERFDEAWAIADAVAPALPGMEPVGLRLKALVKGGQGDRDALLELVSEIRDRDPLKPLGWVFGIEGLAAAEMNPEAERWIGDFLNRFGAQPGVVNQMLARVAMTNNPAILRYTMRRIEEWQKPNVNQRVALAMVLIHSAEWEALEEDFADLLAVENPGAPLAVWLQAVTEAVRPDNPPHLLEALLGRGPPQLMFARAMAHGFATAERWELVKLVVDSALRAHQYSVSLQRYGEQAEAALQTAAEDTRAGDLVAATRFDYTEKDVPRIKFTLRRAVEAEQWDDAETMIRQIRRERPVWLRDVQTSLDWAEAHVAATRSDYDRLTILAPAVLTQDGELAGWFTDQAELAVERGYESSAIRLLRIVLEKEKFYHRARALLKELTEVPEPEDGEDGAEDAPTNP